MRYTDQLNNNLNFPEVPERIVSLVPSITELLCTLGAEKQLIGVTKFCIHPEHVRNKINRIGGTKNPNIESIHELDPDLIIANKEENRLEDIIALKERYQVYVSDIVNTESSFNMIQDIGTITGHSLKAREIISDLRTVIDDIIPLNGISALYLIWKDPVMAIGSNTYINSILSICGIENAYKGKSRYPELTDQMINELNPDLLLLSSEPYPFKERDLQKFKNEFPKLQVLLVDGEVFSWYGSRILYKKNYLNQFTESLRVIN